MLLKFLFRCLRRTIVLGKRRKGRLQQVAPANTRLCLLAAGSGMAVYDSRSGEELEHDLSPLAARVLRHLERPTTIEELNHAFQDVSGFDGRREITYLEDRGLLFEEGRRYMSLVVE